MLPATQGVNGGVEDVGLHRRLCSGGPARLEDCLLSDPNDNLTEHPKGMRAETIYSRHCRKTKVGRRLLAAVEELAAKVGTTITPTAVAGAWCVNNSALLHTR